MTQSASLLAATVVVAELQTIILGKQAEELDTPEGNEAPGFQAAALIATQGGRPARQGAESWGRGGLTQCGGGRGGGAAAEEVTHQESSGAVQMLLDR